MVGLTAGAGVVGAIGALREAVCGAAACGASLGAPRGFVGAESADPEDELSLRPPIADDGRAGAGTDRAAAGLAFNAGH